MLKASHLKGNFHHHTSSTLAKRGDISEGEHPDGISRDEQVSGLAQVEIDHTASITWLQNTTAHHNSSSELLPGEQQEETKRSLLLVK